MNRQKSYISFAGACFAMFVFVLYILLSGCANVPIEREKIVEQWCAQPENDCFTPDTLPTGRAFSTQVEIDVLLKAFCEEYPDKCTELKLQLLPPDPKPAQTNDHPEDLLGGFRHDPDDDADDPAETEPEGEEPGKDPPDITPEIDPPDNSGPGFPSPPGNDKNPGDDPDDGGNGDNPDDGKDPGCSPGDKGGRSDHGKGDHSAGKGGGHDRGDHDGRGDKADSDNNDDGHSGDKNNGHGHGRENNNGRGNGRGKR